jgi:predicted dehydrogenase
MSGESGKIGVAVMAGGGRARGVVQNLLRDSNNNVEVLSVFDPDKEVAKNALEYWKMPNALICDSVEEAVRTPGVDWVLVFSPNAFHKGQILAGFAAGKNVFSEKPLATTIEDCQAIYDAHHKSGCLFATGFVLRYSPIYKKAKEILDSGKLGRILSIDANENIGPEHGGYIMTNWRRLTKFSGPHILEKCCHDLDMLNFFTESVPSRIAAFGGLDFFVPENQKMMDKYGKKTFMTWYDPHGADSPFTADKDMMDNQVAIMEYRNGIRVQFQATMSNAIPERRMFFSCTEGTMILELYASTIRYRGLGDSEMTKIDYAADGHGGGDDHIMKELYKSMVENSTPKCGGDEGLESAVVALSIDRAIRERIIVDLEPVWNGLNR